MFSNIWLEVCVEAFRRVILIFIVRNYRKILDSAASVPTVFIYVYTSQWYICCLKDCVSLLNLRDFACALWV